MFFPFTRFIFVVSFVVFCTGNAFGESNFDLFFKNTTQYQDVVVKKVISTDTIVLKEKVGEKGEVIKLIGLRAPKPPKRETEDIDRDQFGFVKKEPVSPFKPHRKP